MVEPAIDDPDVFGDPGAFVESPADEPGAFVEPAADDGRGVNPPPFDDAWPTEEPAEPVLETPTEAREVEIPTEGREVVPRPGVDPPSAA